MKTFRFGNKTIAYTLERRARKTLAITVRPDLRIYVRAPIDAEEAAIERVLRKRVMWILQQQRFFAQFLPRTPARQYVSGETHLYLGRQYRLRIRHADQEEVILMGGYIYIFVGETSDRTRIKALLECWYVAHARERFHERLAECLKSIAGWHIATPRLDIRRMAKRWGSCTSSETLALNPDLIRAPRACIDYVIMHELCHLRYPNHSAAFYNLLSSVMPDWQSRKIRLERMLS